MRLWSNKLSFALALALTAACGTGGSTTNGMTPSDGDGDGNGNADSDGSGDGSGDGAGDGSGDGAGDSSGDADGNGNADGDSSDGDGGNPSQSLLPWKEGNSWTYRVTKGGVVSTKVTTVGPEEPVGGSGPNKDKLAFKVTTKKGATDETVSWQAVVGNKVIRYRELSYGATSGVVKVEEHWNPYKLHVDSSPEHTAAGAQWSEVYDETKLQMGLPEMTGTRTDTWMVDSASEQITVEAGTFTAVVLRKSNGTDVKTYWYVPGVGKVKEVGAQVEELVEYHIEP